MNILFFDTETTGLPAKGRHATLESQPYVVQLAASLYDGDRRPVMEVSVMVRLPEGIIMPDIPFQVHGIAAETSRVYGLKPATALGLLRHMADRADRHVAHNIQYDSQLIRFMAEREGLTSPIPRALEFCTCNAATPVVNLPPTAKMLAAGFNNPKRASLEECYQHFFGESLEGAHDALVDTRGCARVYYHMLDNGMISET